MVTFYIRKLILVLSLQLFDWDLFSHYRHLNNSFVVIPEVPRTKHFGGGGVHVSGYVQETTYNLRPLNKRTDVNITLTRMWSRAYIIDRMDYILKAQVVNITENPCKTLPIPVDGVSLAQYYHRNCIAVTVEKTFSKKKQTRSALDETYQIWYFFGTVCYFVWQFLILVVFGTFCCSVEFTDNFTLVHGV